MRNRVGGGNAGMSVAEMTSGYGSTACGCPDSSSGTGFRSGTLGLMAAAAAAFFALYTAVTMASKRRRKKREMNHHDDDDYDDYFNGFSFLLESGRKFGLLSLALRWRRRSEKYSKILN